MTRIGPNFDPIFPQEPKNVEQISRKRVKIPNLWNHIKGIFKKYFRKAPDNLEEIKRLSREEMYHLKDKIISKVSSKPIDTKQARIFHAIEGKDGKSYLHQIVQNKIKGVEKNAHEKVISPKDINDIARLKKILLEKVPEFQDIALEFSMKIDGLQARSYKALNISELKKEQKITEFHEDLFVGKTYEDMLQQIHRDVLTNRSAVKIYDSRGEFVYSISDDKDISLVICDIAQKMPGDLPQSSLNFINTYLPITNAISEALKEDKKRLAFLMLYGCSQNTFNSVYVKSNGTAKALDQLEGSAKDASILIIDPLNLNLRGVQPYEGILNMLPGKLEVKKYPFQTYVNVSFSESPGNAHFSLQSSDKKHHAAIKEKFYSSPIDS